MRLEASRQSNHERDERSREGACWRDARAPTARRGATVRASGG
jgi:hypothetical protein